jgi:hypothetical protein
LRWHLSSFALKGTTDFLSDTPKRWMFKDLWLQHRTQQNLPAGVFLAGKEKWRCRMLSPTWRIHLSWLILLTGGLWGSLIAYNTTSDPLPQALKLAYLLWSLYWGAPLFLHWWRKVFVHFVGPTSLMSFGCGPQFIVAFIALVLLGPPFCVLGGGIYQFVACLRISRFQF